MYDKNTPNLLKEKKKKTIKNSLSFLFGSLLFRTQVLWKLLGQVWLGVNEQMENEHNFTHVELENTHRQDL